MNPQDLKSLADYQFNRTTYLKNLKESVDAKLTVVHNGGMFAVTTELIGFLSAWTEPDLVVGDMYGNPIRTNRTQLLSDAMAVYRTATLSWAEEFEKSARLRRAANV
jgi:hypothetical protein